MTDPNKKQNVDIQQTIQQGASSRQQNAARQTPQHRLIVVNKQPKESSIIQYNRGVTKKMPQVQTPQHN